MLRLGLLILLAACQAAAADGTRAVGASERPNIILILADDLGYSDLGCYGSEIATPNLDFLASQGLRFTQFYNAARCCPTRAALLTGQYPHTAGIGHMTGDLGLPAYTSHLSDRCVTIAEALRAAGYRTAMSGKWHVGMAEGHRPLDRGFEHYFGILSGACNYFQPERHRMLMREERHIPEVDPGFYLTDAITDEAIDRIGEYSRADEPFFLYVSYTAPHAPLHAPPEEIAKYRGKYGIGWDEVRRHRYARMVELGVIDSRWPLSVRDAGAPAWAEVYDKETEALKMAVFAAQIDRMDQGIGRIVERVRACGIERNTLIMFLSDNGGCAENIDEGTPGAPIGTIESATGYGLSWANVSDTPFRRFKRMTHEGGIATPLIVYWPAVIRQGGRITGEVGHVIDLLPTCLDAAGVAYPERHDGRDILPSPGLSLLPVFEGRDREGHECLFWEHEGHRAVRRGRWKLVAYYPGAWELYDLEADRTEAHDLADAMPDRVAELRARYEAWAARCGVVPWEDLPHRARAHGNQTYLEDGHPKGPVLIRSGEPQLFVDDWILASSRHLMRTVHRPVKDDGGQVPVIPPPGDAVTLSAKGSIVFDARRKQYVMFAKALPSTKLHRYTSADGLHWTHSGPIELDDRHPVTGRRMDRQYAAMHCVFHDAADAEYPYKGWVFFGNWGDQHEGVYYMRSADGIHWNRGPMVVQGYAGPGDPSAVTIRQDGHTVYGIGDTTRFSWDPIGKRFLGIFKFFTTKPAASGNHLRSRAYAFFDRLDQPFDIHQMTKVALLPPARAIDGDLPADEYYESTAWRYGSLWMGELLVWHNRDDQPWSAAGCSAVKLVSSRDGLEWSKVGFPDLTGSPGVFIPAGEQGGNDGRNDGGHLSLFNQGPLRIRDELIFYYGAASFGKTIPPPERVSGGGIFRARLRVDGFVSVDALGLETRPLRFDGEELYVNGRGSIIVEVLAPDGEVRGRAFIPGDDIAHRIRFNGKTLREILPDGLMRLRFAVDQGGRLYSFTVR